MATVYLAREMGPQGFRRYVALKLIKHHLQTDPEVVAMFADEARLAARLAHPNLCPVYDYGEIDDTLFIAMEFLDGRPLSEVMTAAGRQPGLTETEEWVALAAHFIAEASEGLHAVHEATDEQGQALLAVHRDVSPQNIFITFDGTVRVVDLGVARFVRRSHETKAGVMKGKYAYMAPEQLYRSDVDRRADVWALGVCLWELLTSAPLYADFVSRMDAEESNVPALAPSSLMIRVPEELDQVTLGALTRGLDLRTPTAREVGRSLRRYLHRLPNPVGPAEVADLMNRLFRSQANGETRDLKPPKSDHPEQPTRILNQRRFANAHTVDAATVDEAPERSSSDWTAEVTAPRARPPVPAEGLSFEDEKTVEAPSPFDTSDPRLAEHVLPPSGDPDFEPTVVPAQRPGHGVAPPGAHGGLSGLLSPSGAPSAHPPSASPSAHPPSASPSGPRGNLERFILGAVAALLVVSIALLLVALLTY